MKLSLNTFASICLSDLRKSVIYSLNNVMINNIMILCLQFSSLLTKWLNINLIAEIKLGIFQIFMKFINDDKILIVHQYIILHFFFI